MRIAFSPSVYEHAAFLIGASPWDVSRDARLLYEAHRKAYDLYGHSPIVVGIDIYNLEAEAYGCVVRKPGGDGIPAIETPLLQSLDDARDIRPFKPEMDGRIPMVIEAAVRLRQECRAATVLVPLSGPFSIAVSLRGITGLLEDIALRPDDVREFLLGLVDGQTRFAAAVVKAGLDVAFFESAAAPPLLSPKHFREIELPALKETMASVGRIVGRAVPCIIGGDTRPILRDILATGTGFVICPAETDQAAFMRIMDDFPNVKVRINLDPLTVARGPRERLVAEIERILALARRRPNVLLGTGALPYETPPDNVLFIKGYVA
jgi:uroporphyrinogen decarboxylase